MLILRELQAVQEDAGVLSLERLVVDLGRGYRGILVLDGWSIDRWID